jgi:hypothetical protein
LYHRQLLHGVVYHVRRLFHRLRHLVYVVLLVQQVGVEVLKVIRRTF